MTGVEALMANDDDKKEPPFRPARPEMGWLDTTGSMDSPMMRQRNNALYDSIIQPGSEFPLHPQQPQQTIVADVLQKMLTISNARPQTLPNRRRQFLQHLIAQDWSSKPKA